jgi:hypothetical protein
MEKITEKYQRSQQENHRKRINQNGDENEEKRIKTNRDAQTYQKKKGRK